MGAFLESEKLRQTELKASSALFSEQARGAGSYRRIERPFCLPRSHAEENLWSGIRAAALELFSARDIRWHGGDGSRPTNHLCSSQVCCVNFLLPFANQPRALAALLKPVFPNLRQMLPVEGAQLVTFEWIGERNYLGEHTRSGKRARGAHVTSADALAMFKRSDGARQAVLIEWKYTEAYLGGSLAVARSGTDRREIYRPLLAQPDCPLRLELIGSLDSLFIEPFYQFMRQQLLAAEMERARELGADLVSVLHIAPACNADFRTVTSPGLSAPGASATGVWSRLVRDPSRFVSASTEALFGRLSAEELPELADWLSYVRVRYPWAFPPYHAPPPVVLPP